MLNTILNLLFPEKCLGCKESGTLLCELCTQNMKTAERETARNILALFDYREGVIKRALHALKYYKKKGLAEILGSVLYENMLEEISALKTFSIGKPIIVIPVPLSNSRYKERGYNQADLIAKGFMRNAPKELFELKTNIIIKAKDTKAQARIKDRKERLRNISGAFAINRDMNEISGRTIIVIDDITTTGGTITEIIKLLKENGAKKVIGLAVAH